MSQVRKHVFSHFLHKESWRRAGDGQSSPARSRQQVAGREWNPSCSLFDFSPCRLFTCTWHFKTPGSLHKCFIGHTFKIDANRPHLTNCTRKQSRQRCVEWVQTRSEVTKEREQRVLAETTALWSWPPGPVLTASCTQLSTLPCTGLFTLPPAPNFLHCLPHLSVYTAFSS